MSNKKKKEYPDRGYPDKKKTNPGKSIKETPLKKKEAKNSTVLTEDTVLVIGGGASGLMAAIMAARCGARVTLLEHNDRNGKKLNATGNGKCNFTNALWHEGDIRGNEPEFAEKALSLFSVEDTIAFFRELGVVPVNKNGYYYPGSAQASSVSALLTMAAQNLGIKMKTREHVHTLKPFILKNAEGKESSFWQVLTDGWHYEAKSVILACGSCASAISGSDGSGYELAKALGHTIITPLPALTGLRLKDPGKIFTRWAGVRSEGKISVFIEGKVAAEAQGELQLTDYGVSGIPVFQVSRYAIRALNEDKKVNVVLDFAPSFSMEELEEMMQNRKKICPYKTEEEQFLGWIPDKLAAAVMEMENPLRSLKEFRLTVKEGMPFASAQVASGGVSTREICENTMESRLCKGIYFSGEIVDIDGTCGGYNLQWAWSSGAVAGMSAAGKELT